MLLLTFAVAATSQCAAGRVADESFGSVDACVSDEDCYGGKCLPAGKCLCPPLWTGPTCQILRLKPARVATPGLLLPETSTWGGGAVEDKAGLWHMFAAKIKAHCGLHSWGRNSEIVHATAPAPDGPYQLVGTVLPTFSHGPAPTLLSDGRVVLGELGCGNQTQPIVLGCSNGTTPTTVAQATTPVSATNTRPGGKSNCDWAHWKGVLVSSDAAGAPFSGKNWRQMANWSGYGLVVRAGPDSWHNGDSNGSIVADNPSFWRFENGSFLLAYANKLKHPEGPGAPKWTGHKHVGLAVGELPLDGGPLQPFTDIVSEPVFPWEAEDPDIWVDTTNNLTAWRWHILAHRLVSNISTEVCAHAVAASPFGPWKVATTPAYTKDVEWVDDTGAITKWTLQGRERPRIIVDRTGTPVALSNGVSPGRAPTPVTPRGYAGDFSYTHVQMLDPVSPDSLS